ETYEIQGEFTMLGITKELPVTLRRIEMGDKIMIVGSGEIDRTLFGMIPSATEGNVVTFEYQVEIK
ncbi:MAG: YceI family protein, partial [Crocinitomicaceae bacterium]|nr:YceI family protein [Crocinitomicaceae bacterium]